MAYSGIQLQEVFPIDGISTIHHFEYNSDFIFKSEYHDYWTFFFVEEGIFEISQQGKKSGPVTLEKNHLYLQAPEENYSFRSLGEDTALVFTIGFYSKDENLRLLSGQDYFCDQELTDLLHSIARESRLCFTSRVDTSSVYYLERKFNQPYGGEQFITIWLKSLLIEMMRRQSRTDRLEEPIFDSESLRRDILLFERITDYYSAHISEHLKIEDICKEFSIGRSHLQRIFRKQTGMGAMEYFCQMRVSVARDFIRDKKMSLTDTSRELGYTYIQYFSKQFKKITGMTPSEYKNSIQSAQSDPVYKQIHS